MLRDLSRAVAGIRDPKLFSLLMISLGLTIVALILLTMLTSWAIRSIDFGGGGLFGFSLEDLAIDWLVDTIAFGLSAILALMLFPVVAISMQSLFLDAVANAVEARWYPHLPPAREQRIGEIIMTALRLTMIVLGLNLLLVIVWLFMIATAFLSPFAPIPYYVVNSYLFGREYFELLALRRMTPAAATQLRKQKLGGNFADGLLLTLLFTVPILNLVGPMLAAAYMTHRFHRVWTPATPSGATDIIEKGA